MECATVHNDALENVPQGLCERTFEVRVGYHWFNFEECSDPNEQFFIQRSSFARHIAMKHRYDDSFVADHYIQQLVERTRARVKGGVEEHECGVVNQQIKELAVGKDEGKLRRIVVRTCDTSSVMVACHFKTRNVWLQSADDLFRILAAVWKPVSWKSYLSLYK